MIVENRLCFQHKTFDVEKPACKFTRHVLTLDGWEQWRKGLTKLSPRIIWRYYDPPGFLFWYKKGVMPKKKVFAGRNLKRLDQDPGEEQYMKIMRTRQTREISGRSQRWLRKTWKLETSEGEVVDLLTVQSVLLELEVWKVWDKEKEMDLTWLFFDKLCWTWSSFFS